MNFCFHRQDARSAQTAQATQPVSSVATPLPYLQLPPISQTVSQFMRGFFCSAPQNDPLLNLGSFHMFIAAEYPALVLNYGTQIFRIIAGICKDLILQISKRNDPSILRSPHGQQKLCQPMAKSPNLMLRPRLPSLFQKQSIL